MKNHIKNTTKKDTEEASPVEGNNANNGLPTQRYLLNTEKENEAESNRSLGQEVLHR